MSAHFDTYCILISHNHDWLPQCFLYTTTLMLLHVIKFLWPHQSVQMMGGIWSTQQLQTPFSGTTLRHLINPIILT
jgi:hypothetical protein